MISPRLISDFPLSFPNFTISHNPLIWSMNIFMQSNAFMEGVSSKIRRQIEELERVSGVNTAGLTVDGVPVDSYLTRFCFISFYRWSVDSLFLFALIAVFVLDLDLFGMMLSIRLCLLWRRLLMAFIVKLLRLRMISRFSFSSQSLVLVRFDLYVWFHGCDE